MTQDALVLERGSMVHRASADDLRQDTATLDRLVGLRVSGAA
jgi:branched-chain amino acid transport system ATP-binding protein